MSVSPPPLSLAGAALAAFLAGGINSAAGGGTMISFPALVALGLPPLIANATNTVGIWPGAIGSVWGFRPELSRVPKKMFWLMLPSLVGGAVGGILLRYTSSQAFDRIVPWLILFATILFIVQPPIQKRLFRAGAPQGRNGAVIAVLLQIGVGVYGGYFGAGMSILTLSVLGLLGMSDMLEMTAMTSLLSIAVNGVAGLLFLLTGIVDWHYSAVMAVAAVAGGYGAAGAARKLGKVVIRRLVITVGLSLAVAMFVRVMR